MELGLSLGEAPAAKPFFLAEKGSRKNGGVGLELGFCMGLGFGMGRREEGEERRERRRSREIEEDEERDCSGDPPLQLELLPFSPVPRNPPLTPSPLIALPWPSEQGNSDGSIRAGGGGLDVNRVPAAEEMEEGALVVSSSPNSTVSSFQMDFTFIGGGGSGGGEDGGERAEAERASSRASDEDENGLTRKKLRLSKEQSAYLEESFKEHSTLNPKQKLALAKQLNLRPRQVEVWFQNRRARTKLKQTEVDCEYLKRCCEKLTEENRRLQKELQELRALKTAHPFYMHLPATTLTMCPSCERVATTTTNNNTNNTTTANNSNSTPSAAPPADHANTSTTAANHLHTSPGFPLRPRFYPFSQQQQPPSQITAAPRHQPSAAS